MGAPQNIKTYTSEFPNWFSEGFLRAFESSILSLNAQNSVRILTNFRIIYFFRNFLWSLFIYDMYADLPNFPDCSFSLTEEDADITCPGRYDGVHDPFCVHWNPSPSKTPPEILFPTPSDDRIRRKLGIGKPGGALPSPVLLPDKTVSSWELTLTSTQNNPAELKTWIDKITKSKMFGITGYRYSFELQENGNPHIHALINSSKKHLDATLVKKLKFPYRYSFTRVKDLAAYYKYIMKDIANPELQAYCAQHNIVQNFSSYEY